jgi:hypothetical protein
MAGMRLEGKNMRRTLDRISLGLVWREIALRKLHVQINPVNYQLINRRLGGVEKRVSIRVK